MISKAQRGSDMRGLVRYLFGPGRAEEHSNQRIVGASDPTWTGISEPDTQTLRQLADELHDPVMRHGDSTKAGYVYHVVVAVPAGDGVLTDAQWQATAQRIADKLGFDDQVHWVAVNHGLSTNGNDHIHFVANLIRDVDGRAENLPFDRMRRRQACIEMEEQFGLTATSPAGQGQPGSLSRREVEQLRSGAVANVSDLDQHRVATIVRAVATGTRSEPEFVQRLRGEGLVVRARQDKGRPGVITGYSVAARGADNRLVWYGGGRLGKDLRLPALRTKWGQTDQQRKTAAAAWLSAAAQRLKAETINLAGAADALSRAAGKLAKVPPQDRFSWYVAATESAGVIAAAANTTTDDRLRRDLIKAWQAINRATPNATSIGVDIAPGDATQLRFIDAEQHAARLVAAWPQAATTPTEAIAETSGETSALLAGASRVLMAAKIADAPDRARVRALIVQAVELAAQISRTIAAHQDATAAQHRAAQATAHAGTTASAPARAPGWQFTKTGDQVLKSARNARAAGSESDMGPPRQPAPAPGLDPHEPGR